MKKLLLVISIIAAGIFNIHYIPQAMAAAGSSEEGLEYILFQDIPQVVTASKKAESLDSAPNVMYVITKEQIKNRGYKNLEDILNDIPGFSVWFENQSHAVQVRGIGTADNEGLLVLVNGHNIRGPFEPDPLGGEVLLNMVKQVEIIVGPGSVLYGSDSVYGIVNVITEQFEGKGISTKIGLNDQSYSEASLMFGAKENDNLYGSIAFSYFERDGFDPIYDGNLAGTKILGDALPSYNIVAQGQAGDLLLQYFHHNYTFTDTQTYYTYGGATGETREYIDAFDAKYTNTFSDQLTGLFTLSYDNKRHIRRVTDTKGQPIKIGAFTFDLQELVYSAEYSIQYKSDMHTFQFGLQGSQHTHDNNYWGIIDPAQPDYDVNAASPYDSNNTGAVNSYWWPDIRPGETYNLGCYISEEFNPTENLKLTAAVRADKNGLMEGENDEWYYTPRAAIGFKVSDNYHIKTMYNRSTRFPGAQMSERNISWGKDKPWVEQATNFANINYNASKPSILDAVELQNIFYVMKSRITFNIFYQKLKDVINWAGPHTNIGNYDGKGAELSIMTKFNENIILTLGGSYSDNDMEYTVDISPTFGSPQVISRPETGELVGVPEYQANAILDVNITDKWSVSTTVRYFTGQVMNTQKYANDPANWTSADNCYYVNLSTRYKQIADIFDISLTAQNLLDNDDPVSAQANWRAYTMRPLSIILGVDAKF